MSRDLSVAQQTATTARHRQVAALIELLFISGTLRLTSAPWDVHVGADTYLKSNRPSYIRPLKEATGSVEGLELGMSGLNTAIVDIAAAEPYHGRLVKLYKAYLDADTNAVIGSPVIQFVGRMKVMSISETNNEASIVVSAEHYEIDLQRPAPLRYNGADQERLFPGDKGCEFVEQLAEKKIVWPHREVLLR